MRKVVGGFRWFLEICIVVIVMEDGKEEIEFISIVKIERG